MEPPVIELPHELEERSRFLAELLRDHVQGEELAEKAGLIEAIDRYMASSLPE